MADDHPLGNRVGDMRSILTEDPQTWDILWKQKVTPWDSGEIQPPLRQVVESGEIPFTKGGRALVPGCGRGYDTIYLASALGHDTIGLDASATAVEAANQLAQSSSLDLDLVSKIHFEVADFFKYEVSEDKKFDLIYDYTFFVAIPPSKRSLWGSQINSLIKPGGYLITLMFPHVPVHDPQPYAAGPPFYSNFTSYEEVLRVGGSEWEVVLNKIPDDDTLLDVHKGKDRIVVWKRTV
ncbi:MAG: thiol methyltransferase 1 [Lentinula lateritia]|uniref:S-adenosyl-L-methionine-dependent methyltransferase n=1 Tax=Lentinula lateritia TaxID=40482 RepID=A0ABQ8V6C3_9AGAR|nr:MAG: thiol methyltransferase 1 [Lentinula lateritia]KAJ4476540.1 S-adenosyl-L-methionine-dependent methyltransferase [Lentinula lateritia]